MTMIEQTVYVCNECKKKCEGAVLHDELTWIEVITKWKRVSRSNRNGDPLEWDDCKDVSHLCPGCAKAHKERLSIGSVEVPGAE